MIDLLLGIPKQLDDLLTRLSASWANNVTSKVSNLDAAISTRAGAATALSTAVWDAATAGKINSGGIPGTVKSIQTGWVNDATTAGSGEDSYYFDVTLGTAVVVAKCVVTFTSRMDSIYIAEGYTGLPAIESARLMSTTSLRLSRNYARTGSVVGRWTVVEYY